MASAACQKNSQALVRRMARRPIGGEPERETFVAGLDLGRELGLFSVTTTFKRPLMSRTIQLLFHTPASINLHSDGMVIVWETTMRKTF